MTRQRMKITSAGSTVFGARIIAKLFEKEHAVAVTVETDHGHLLFEAAQTGTLDADVAMLPADMID